jgi:uncharacterized protein involved in outer membrane biogenesis
LLHLADRSQRTTDVEGTVSLRRKIVVGAAAAIVVLIAALALAPILLRDRIEARVKTAISSNLDARIDWRELRLGLLRTFPNLSVELQDLVVVGVDEFASDTLIAVPRFNLVLDLSSVLGSLRARGALVVRSIELDRPKARLLVRADGTANWDILRERPPAPTSPGGRST